MPSDNIHADVAKNRLYVVLEGFISDEESTRYAEKVLQQASLLKPGFSCITDISTFKPASQKGAEVIKMAQKSLLELGMKRVVRVSGSALVSMQFQRTSREVGYGADTVATMAEAEAVLDLAHQDKR